MEEKVWDVDSVNCDQLLTMQYKFLESSVGITLDVLVTDVCISFVNG